MTSHREEIARNRRRGRQRPLMTSGGPCLYDTVLPDRPRSVPPSRGHVGQSVAIGFSGGDVATFLLGERPPRPDGAVAPPRRRVLRSTPKHCFARPCDQEPPERTSDALRVARQRLGRGSTNARRALRRRPSRASTGRMRARARSSYSDEPSCRLRGAPGVAISGNFQGDSLTRAPYSRSATEKSLSSPSMASSMNAMDSALTKSPSRASFASWLLMSEKWSACERGVNSSESKEKRDAGQNC